MPLLHVRPSSFDTAKPIPVAPPSKRRPTWNVATVVRPTVKLSGSTSLSGWPPGSRKASREIRLLTSSQSAATTSTRSAMTVSTPEPQATRSRTSYSAAMRSFPAPPAMTSWPGPPLRKSLPPPPRSRSLPAPPEIESARGVPTSRSPFAVPTIVLAVAVPARTSASAAISPRARMRET